MKNLIRTLAEVVGCWIGYWVINAGAEWLYFNTYILDGFYYRTIGEFRGCQHLALVTFIFATYVTGSAIGTMIRREVNGYYIKEM